jgi:hypothetical protein
MAKMNDPAESLVDQPDQHGGDFAYDVSASSARVYSGPYPMMDHIMMPVFEPTSELLRSTSFELERNGGDEKSEFRGNRVQRAHGEHR